MTLKKRLREIKKDIKTFTETEQFDKKELHELEIAIVHFFKKGYFSAIEDVSMVMAESVGTDMGRLRIDIEKEREKYNTPTQKKDYIQ